MVRHYGGVTVLAVGVSYWFHGGTAQYESCTNGTVADIGNGRCDAALNVASCGYDGGDCCPCTCSNGPDHSCSDNNFDCVYPDCDDLTTTSEETTCNEEWIGDGWCDDINNNAGCSWDGGDCCECSCVSGYYSDCGSNGYSCQDPVCSFDPVVVAENPDCTGNWTLIGDSECNAENNNAACGYDGGDCCLCSCSGIWCGLARFDCLDPTALDELYECMPMPPDTVPCAAGVQQVWTVQTSEEAQALAAAVNCSGGSFEVEWRGRVVVDETIYVAAGTVLAVSGADTASVIDGNSATRLFTVVDAVLHLSNVNITSGASLAGGAIAAARSVLTLDRTNFDGNSAVWNGGAVFASDGSNVTCTGGGTFANNRAENDGGGAMLVTGSSTVSCGGSWVNNTARNRGGALAVAFDSSASLRDGTTFAFNFGGVGTLAISNGSSASWSGATSFISNFAYWLGAVAVEQSSTVSWSGSTEFVSNGAWYGGAVGASVESSISWTGATDFTSNTALNDGGAVFSLPLDPLVTPENSFVAMNGPTTFSNNSCGGSGGAMALLGEISVGIGVVDVSFINNTAEVAGGAVFVSGTGVGPTFPGVRFVSNSAQVGGAVSTVGSGYLTEVSPTTFARCHFIDNRATATGGAIETAAGRDSFVGSVFEGNTAGTGGALRLAGRTNMENCSFVENLSDEGGGAAVSNIGSMEMSNVSFSGNVFDCEPGMFLNYSAMGDVYEATCDGCPTTCVDCSFEKQLSVPTCTGQLDHTVSAGGTLTLEQLAIDPGYWRATEFSEVILACYHTDACLGGLTGAAGYCREGYEGPYCSVCSDGYNSEPGFVCSECSDSVRGIVLAAVLAMLALVAAAGVISYVMAGETGMAGRGVVERLRRYIPLQSVKIIVVAWQILTQFGSLANVTYPGVYQRFLDALEVFNFNLSWLLSAGCIVDVDFHHRLLMATVGPIVILLFLAATYLTAARINRGVPDALQTIWNKHVSIALLLTFLVYSSVSSVLFMAFACEDLEDGKNYLRADYRIECDSTRHRGFQLYAGLMVLIYPVGIPAFYSVLLFRDRKILRHDQADWEETARVNATSALWKPYKPSVFYYEVIECGRRVLLAGVVVFIYPNTAAQIAISLLMAFTFAIVSEWLAPYASRWDSWLNRIGHAVVYVSMYDALLLKVDVSEDSSSSQQVFEALLVAAHSCLILVVVAETVVLAWVTFRDGRKEVSQGRKVAPAEQNSIY